LNDTAISILIAGDMVPTKSNEGFFIKGDVSSLIGNSLYEIFQKADITSVNLECPLTTSDTPIKKIGPNLRALPETIKGIKALDPTIIGLANNHILDYGEKGLADTLSLLTDNRIPYVGVGNNLKDAAQSIHIVEEKGCRIGFYACAEHEFSIATEKTSGANPFDALMTGDVIKSLKADCKLDTLIVLYHGGKEYYQYPSPGLQKVCRHLVQKGANLVVCQHSHCIGAYEHYQDGDIVYGQGNFVFDMKHPFSINGLLIRYHLFPEGRKEIEFIPIEKQENGAIRKSSPAKSKEIIESFMKRSKEILDREIVEKNYQVFSRQMINTYLYILSPFGKWISRIDRHLLKGVLIRFFYTYQKRQSILNNLRCEAHSEAITSGLKAISNRRKRK
jgi:poly-gamma-glutamate synthesis protein (capsule biosynthesis protein)